MSTASFVIEGGDEIGPDLPDTSPAVMQEFVAIG